jgi:rubrerythrin
LIEENLNEQFPFANSIAASSKDRGALRALKWSEQVTRMLRAHISRLEAEGPAFLATSNVYVCEVCGFVYIGDEKTDICPVCKVPSFKMKQIERRA